MKISKLLSVLCALTMAANGLTVQAEDNSAQAAARIALAKKLFELDAAPSSTTNAVAEKPAVVPPVKTAEPAATVSEKTVSPVAPIRPPAGDDAVVMTPVNQPLSKEAKAKAKAEKAAAQAQAKKAADQAAADLKAKKAAEKKLAKQQAAEAKAKAKAAKAAAAAPAVQAEVKPAATPVVSAPAEVDNNSAAQKAALAAAMADTATVQTKPVVAPVPAPVVPADPTYAGKELGLQPLAAPPLPISATKEEQLQALLAKYKADQISPEQYQTQRAAILAQP